MFAGFRKRMTYANVAATLALVFAMTGGAYAATKIIIKSTNQISPTVLKKLKTKGPAGPAGPAGAAGATGPAGPQGAPGTNGTNGTDGTNGVSVTTESFNGKSGSCTAGGVNVKSASATVPVCNGKEGPEGPAGPIGPSLPEGTEESGTWAFGPAFEGILGRVAISFSIPLETAPTGKVHVINESTKMEIEKPGVEVSQSFCEGTYQDPTVKNDGEACVYVSLIEKADISDGGALVSKSGVVLTTSHVENEAEGFGAWAVKG